MSDATLRDIELRFVRVRYHAAARELTGCAEEGVEVGEALDESAWIALIGEKHPKLAPYLGRFRFAINGDFAGESAQIHPGDEVDVMPPVAGGSGKHPHVLIAAVSTEPLSIDRCYQAVQHASAGGIALFVGVVRDSAEGKDVARLDYEAHTELAIKETERVLARVADEVPGARLAAVHRVGELAVGDLAVVVAASAPHRGEAFKACRLAIDRIKETVPVWKKEWAPDGSANWVNLEQT